VWSSFSAASSQGHFSRKCKYHFGCDVNKATRYKAKALGFKAKAKKFGFKA